MAVIYLIVLVVGIIIAFKLGNLIGKVENRFGINKEAEKSPRNKKENIEEVDYEEVDD